METLNIESKHKNQQKTNTAFEGIICMFGFTTFHALYYLINKTVATMSPKMFIMPRTCP